MRTLLYLNLFALPMLLSFGSCNAQQNLTLKYIGNQSTGTLNTNFVNNTFLFLDKRDTIQVNVKVPFDTAKMEIINRGLYYNCILTPGNAYIITLKKISKNGLPEETNSYYKTNAIFNDKQDSAKFIEVPKDTQYMYKGYYERYVDINNILYEIIGLSPDAECFYPH